MIVYALRQIYHHKTTTNNQSETIDEKDHLQSAKILFILIYAGLFLTSIGIFAFVDVFLLFIEKMNTGIEPPERETHEIVSNIIAAMGANLTTVIWCGCTAVIVWVFDRWVFSYKQNGPVSN